MKANEERISISEALDHPWIRKNTLKQKNKSDSELKLMRAMTLGKKEPKKNREDKKRNGSLGNQIEKLEKRPISTNLLIESHPISSPFIPGNFEERKLPNTSVGHTLSSINTKFPQKKLCNSDMMIKREFN